MANFNALSSLIRTLLREQRADFLRINLAIYPPQFLNNQVVKLMLNCVSFGVSALIAQTALSYPYLNGNSIIQ